MKCVVPLAGPDLWTPEWGLRPLYPYGGEPLLRKTLRSRAWASMLAPEDYIFVVRDMPEAAPLLTFLRETWPGAGVVTLSHLTGGAMLSALAGVSLMTTDAPLIVDLADILFELDPQALAFDASDLGAIVPVFASSEPVYSYLRLEHGRVVEAREKQVISQNASAGVYAFRNRAVFTAAAAHALANPETETYRGVFFVCPMVNGVLSAGFEVRAPAATDVAPVGKLFH